MAKTTDTKPTFGTISIEDYVAPEKQPSEYASLVTSLINAGPDKVAAATFETEKDALAFLRSVQTAANEQDKSAMKVSLSELDEGAGFRIAVRVRDKITRTRTGGDVVPE